MPIHTSAKKQVRIAKRANARNRIARSALRTAVKNALTAATKESAEKLLHEAVSVIDTSVKKGILHRNNAAHKKSRIYRHYAGLKT
jgi:small subunit ribosomal protein S20